MLLPTYRASRAGAIATAPVSGLRCSATLHADDAGARARKSLDPVVVTARRLPEVVPDEVVKTRVQTALHEDPYSYDGHVTITVKNGIVRLPGIVLDIGDIHDARRIFRKKVPGVKRVVNELEICGCNGGGGG